MRKQFNIKFICVIIIVIIIIIIINYDESSTLGMDFIHVDRPFILYLI